MEKCFLCDQSAKVTGIGPLDQVFAYDCPNCGRFSISSDVKYSFNIKKEGDALHLLSGYVREMNEREKHDVYLTMVNYKDILASPIIPRTIGAKLEKLLQYTYHRTQYFGKIIYINLESEYAICYASTADDFCKARTAALLIGSIQFIIRFREYEKYLLDRESVDISLSILEEYERRLIKQIREDLGAKNHQGLLLWRESFPNDIYLYDINLK